MKIIYAFIVSIFLFTNVSYSQIKIGIALPLKDNSENLEEKKLGQDIYSGARFALEEFLRENPSFNIIFDVQDTYGNNANVTNIINKFSLDTSIIAVFGPIYSGELSKCAAIKLKKQIPIISPTATGNNIAKNNQYIIQLNPTYEIRGGAMANFAMNNLLMKNFLILSEEKYGKNFADAFTSRVESLGGKIIASKYYAKTQDNLSELLLELKNIITQNEEFLSLYSLSSQQIQKIKEANISNLEIDSLLKLKSEVSIYKLFGKNAKEFITASKLSTKQYSQIKKTKSIILGYVDAIFIPIANYTEINKVVPQYFESGINLPILGTNDWNNVTLLNENNKFLESLTLYFETDYYITNSSIDKFAKLGYNEVEFKNFLFGYDGMKLILDKIKEGHNTREELNNSLQYMLKYPSVHNQVSLFDRTNHQLYIMQYLNNYIIKLSDYIYGY